MIKRTLLSATLAACVTTTATAEAAVAAAFALPTDRYPHNVLGDIPGHGALDVTLASGRVLRMALPDTRVFEDIAPRLADIDGDGQPEVVTVESDQQLGARLTVWSITDAEEAPAIALLAATDFIGTRFRWLAVAGIADFARNGTVQIAYVTMPHLAKRLIVVQHDGNRLVPVAQVDGVTNHRIGDTYITGSIRDCGTGPEIVLPSADWDQIIGVGLTDGRCTATDYGRFTDDATIDRALACEKK